MTTPLLLLTYNCGKTQLSEGYVADKVVGPALSAHMSQCQVAPQLVVLAFEELGPIMEGCFNQLASSYLNPVLKGAQTALDALAPDQSYINVVNHVHGANGLVVFSRATDSDGSNPVKDIAVAVTGVGYLRSSLKGAVGIRLRLGHSLFTFVGAHLAANEGMLNYRNRDFVDIVTMLDFNDGYGAYRPGSHLFFMGDLNYRCTEEPFLQDSVEHDQTEALMSGTSGNSLKDYTRIDELSLARDPGQPLAFLALAEAPITFAPTFKFFERTSTYNRKRTPSWCDRILYQRYDDSEQIHKYASLPDCTESDHRPVYLSISVPESPPASPIDARLALSSSRYRNSLQSYYADKAIGWGLFLSATPTGRAYSVFVAVVLLLAYLVF